MYYVIYAKDNPDSLEKRAKVRAAHIARLGALKKEGRLLMGGPLLGEDGGIMGSLIVVEFDDIALAEEWINADPYIAAEVYEKITIRPFKRVL